MVSGIEALGAASAAISVGSSAWAWIKGLRDLLGDKAIIAALFAGDGNRVEGDARIAVMKIPDGSGKPDRWWFRFVEVVGYLFVALPVDPGIITAYGRQGDALIFQFKEARMAAYDIASHPGPFLVIGYQPKALVEAATHRDATG